MQILWRTVLFIVKQNRNSQIHEAVLREQILNFHQIENQWKMAFCYKNLIGFIDLHKKIAWG